MDFASMFIAPMLIAAAIGDVYKRQGLHSKPKEMPKKQACAAIGQCELMHIYDREFANYNDTVAQVLLTRDVISNKTRKENVINTFNTLLDMGIDVYKRQA